jgi:hypothetical protein
LLPALLLPLPGGWGLLLSIPPGTQRAGLPLTKCSATRTSERRRGGPTVRGGVGADGAYGVVFPESAALPNPRLTPGALNPAVTQANIDETICRRGGYTKSIRPDEGYTEGLKREGIRQYGYSDHRLRDYEEDHLIPLELGGSPSRSGVRKTHHAGSGAVRHRP